MTRQRWYRHRAKYLILKKQVVPVSITKAILGDRVYVHGPL